MPASKETKNDLTLKICLPIFLIGIAWLQEVIDQFLLAGSWNLPIGGNYPWWGIITWPFSHSGFNHLSSNTILFLPLSWLVLSKKILDYVFVWISVLCIVAFTFLFWPSSAHGISGVIFGLFGYLIIIGILERNILTLGLSIIAISYYGDFLTSLIPWHSSQGISWVGHFSGFIGGLIAAAMVYKVPKSR